MSTVEITLQRKVGNEWPAISVFSRPGDFLPIRTESLLQLDVKNLLRYANPKDYGVGLGKALFRDDLRDALTRAQAQAREDQQPLRILLNVEAEDLKPLHWERLCAPLDGVWDFLCLNQSTPYSLYLPSLTDRRFPPIGRRDLRALVLIVGPEELDGDFGLASFDVSASIASLRRSFGNIPHDILATVDGSAGPPTLDALCERLTTGSYSLLHLVCHGRYSPKGDTVLYLPDSRRSPVTATVFIERISRLQGVRGLPHFAFLMTCESANPEAESGFGGLGQRLVRELGLPAVLAMTAPVTIQTGSVLAEAFYARLRDHGEVDRALSEALAGLMDRPDATVPAIFSRLGGRPLFSDALDRPLTSSEIHLGLERLEKLVSERAPVLQDEYTGLLSRLHATGDEVETLSAAARQETMAALESANALSDEIADLSFNALALGRPVPTYDQRCPFRGLASFRPEDRSFFFGREALVRSLLDRLDAYPFLAVLGPSGSGKSSLVLAGLIPAMAKRIPGCSEEVDFAYLTPGADPLPRLEAALASAPDCSLVVVDQFEELFTLCRDESKREEFIRSILPLRPAQRVVLTMRADFWGECAPYTNLKDEMQAHQELVAPLDSSGLRRAIEQQAAAVGLRFEADLAEDILDDVQDEPGAMPLMQHALLLLWERRHGRWLRTSEYRSFGGVQQAIAHTADGLYLKLDQAEQAGVRNIFLRLTRLDEDPSSGTERRDTRRRVALEELVPVDSERGLTVDLVRQLADARLVVTGVNPVDKQEEVEVAHEALIRGWGRLQDWVRADRIFLAWLAQLQAGLRQWQASGRDDGALLRGRPLAEAEGWLVERQGDLSQSEREFIQKSLALREGERLARERLRNLILAGAILAAILMALLGAFGWNRSQEAQRQAATARAQLLAAQGRLVYTEQPLLGLRLALEGLALAPAEATDDRASLLTLLRELAEKGRILTLGTDVEMVFASPDGSLIIVDHRDASGELRRTSGGDAIPLAGQVSNVYFSPDGATFVVGYKDAPGELRRTSGGDAVPLAGEIAQAFFSPDGATFVVSYKDAPGELWRTAGGKPVQLADKVMSVDFSPDGSTFIANYTDAPSELRRAAGGDAVPLAGQVSDVYFSPDGATFVVSYKDAPGELWRTAGGKPVQLADKVMSVDFSPDGAIVEVDYTDAPSELRRAAGGDAVPLKDKVNWVYFSPNGATFVVGYKDAPGELRRTSGGDAVPLAGQVFDVYFSPDGAIVEVDYTDAPSELRRTSGGYVVLLAGDIEEVDFSPDGATFVVSYKDAPGELRQTAGGNAVPLKDKVNWVYFSPDGATVVVGYTDASGELRQTAGGEPVPLAGEVSQAFFSPDGTTVVVSYYDVPGELRQTAGGDAVPLAGQVSDVYFMPDGVTFVVYYSDGRYEVWRGENLLTDLGLGAIYHFFDPQSDRLVIWYIDGQAYILDLAWLGDMSGDPAALPAEELVRIICEGPLASGLWDEADLEPYLDGRKPQACQP